jgi:hypothetical protein
MRRVGRDGEEKAQDDDGRFLKDEAGTFAPLEVAHIIPHSLMTSKGGMAELVCWPYNQTIFQGLSMSNYLPVKHRTFD